MRADHGKVDHVALNNVYESFDSAPPAGQKKNDSSVALALGWSF